MIKTNLNNIFLAANFNKIIKAKLSSKFLQITQNKKVCKIFYKKISTSFFNSS